MEAAKLYKCLCDPQRLRMLSLLQSGPLCVCHLIEILDADQVKVSKQLRYMKSLGLVESERAAQWMVYRLADPDSPLLMENLRCLRSCADAQSLLESDLRKRESILERARMEKPACADAIC